PFLNHKRTRALLAPHVQDEDGYETEMIQTIPDKKEMDKDAWLDAKDHYNHSPEKMREAIRKLLYGDMKQLSGNDYVQCLVMCSECRFRACSPHPIRRFST
ncbi:MAG: hypothetical protein V1737_05190, partial [Chloroflexota bacterium]